MRKNERPPWMTRARGIGSSLTIKKNPLGGAWGTTEGPCPRRRHIYRQTELPHLAFSALTSPYQTVLFYSNNAPNMISNGSSVFHKPDVHPPPSFWSSSIKCKNRNSAASDPISSRRKTAKPRYRPKGSVTADTVCSAQRSFEVYQQYWQQQRQQQKKGKRRNRRIPRRCLTTDEASKATVATDSSLRGARNDYDVRAGGSRRPSQRQLYPHGASMDLSVSSGLRGFRSGNPKVSRTSWADCFQNVAEVPLQRGAAVTDFSGQDALSSTRVLRWGWSAKGDVAEEEKDRTMPPSQSAQLPERRETESEPTMPASVRPRKVAGDRRALSAATDKCETFLETKKGFLARLEAFFVSTADERRHALLRLQHKEALWRAPATEKGTSDLQAERLDLEERAWERVAQQGPDAQAMEKVKLVRGGEEEKSNAASSSHPEATRSLPPKHLALGPQGPRHQRRSVEWKLPTQEMDKTRITSRHEMARSTTEGNEAFNIAKIGVTEGEGARIKRELQEPGGCRASDSRDALADHQHELEDKAEAHLEAERKRLKDGAGQQERDRLESEKNLRIADARNTARLEALERASTQAVRSTITRRDEALKMIDEATAKARDDLQTILNDQKAKVREELRSRHSEDRRISIGGVTRKEERHSLNKVDSLAEESRGMVKRDQGDTTGEKEFQEREEDDSPSPRLQVRSDSSVAARLVLSALKDPLGAVKVLDECGRICRRLLDLASKEAVLLLQDRSP